MIVHFEELTYLTLQTVNDSKIEGVIATEEDKKEGATKNHLSSSILPFTTIFNYMYLLKENVLPHTFKYKLPTPTYLYTPINIHDLCNFYTECLFLYMILRDSN
jgi:hypothetical protein